MFGSPMKRLDNIVTLFLCLLIPKFTCLLGQQQPTLSLDYFNYTTSYRQSVCDRQSQIDNGTLQLRDALAGLELSTWLYKDNRYVLFDDNNETNAIATDYPGLIGVLLDELSDRAGFTWRNSFGVLDNATLPEGKSYTDLLVWTVWAYDISASYWSKSLRRMDLGTSFPEGWYDGRMIMIGVEEDGTASLDIWSFLEPFTTGVWIMILVTIVVSAIVYMFLDWYDSDSDEMRLGNVPGQNLFLSAIMFTGHFAFKPASNSARIMTASLAFWSLIVMSAYTANLASFLVVQNTPSIEINTLGDAVKNDFLICIMANTHAEELVARSYEGARIVRVLGDEVQVYRELRAGMCHIAMASVSSWLEFRGDRSVNGDCRLHWIGRNAHPGEGGFATKSDSGVLCTSMIRDVFNLHLLEMKNDGFVERAWDEHLRRRATVDCDTSALSAEDDDESDGQLSLQAMGGTFIIHYVATGFAIFLAVAMKCFRRKPIWKRTTSSRQMGGTSNNNDSKRIESAMRIPPSKVDQELNPYSEGVLYSGKALPTGNLQDVLQEQNDKLAALEKQNSEMMQMIKVALQNGNLVESPHTMDVVKE